MTTAEKEVMIPTAEGSWDDSLVSLRASEQKGLGSDVTGTSCIIVSLSSVAARWELSENRESDCSLLIQALLRISVMVTHSADWESGTMSVIEGISSNPDSNRWSLSPRLTEEASEHSPVIQKHHPDLNLVLQKKKKLKVLHVTMCHTMWGVPTKKNERDFLVYSRTICSFSSQHWHTFSLPGSALLWVHL